MAKDTKKLDILPDSAYVLGDLSPEELKDRVDNEKEPVSLQDGPDHQPRYRK